MSPNDQKTFRFMVGNRTANAHSISSDHVCLAMSSESIAISIMMTVAEAIATCTALTKAVEVSVAMHPDDFDAVREAERVRALCGDQVVPRLPVEDGSMTARHTKGPWQARRRPRYGMEIFADDGKLLVFSLWQGGAVPYEESLANAHLIAAAPDLVDFARHPQWEVIMGALSKWTNSGGSDLVALGIIGSGLLAIDDARLAAIAKSEDGR